MISNVPGSPVPLYCAGARLEANYPLSVITDGMGLNLTILSYQDRIDFGIIGDREEVPDVWFLAEEVDHAFHELLDLVPAAKPRKKAAAKKKARAASGPRPRGVGSAAGAQARPDLAGGALAALDGALEVPLRARRRVLAGEHDARDGPLEQPPEARDLAGAERRVRAAGPVVAVPGVEPRLAGHAPALIPGAIGSRAASASRTSASRRRPVRAGRRAACGAAAPPVKSAQQALPHGRLLGERAVPGLQHRIVGEEVARPAAERRRPPAQAQQQLGVRAHAQLGDHPPVARRAGRDAERSAVRSAGSGCVRTMTSACTGLR